MINHSSIFNSEIKRFLKTLFYYGGTVYLCLLVLGIFIHLLNKSETWDDFNSNKQNIDILITGSSHAAFGIQPLILDSILGSNSYNLSTPAQSPKTAYILIDYALKNSAVQTVVLDVFFDTWYVNDQFQNQIIPVSQFSPLKLMLQSLKTFSISEFISFTFPITWYKRDIYRSTKDLIRNPLLVVNSKNRTDGASSVGLLQKGYLPIYKKVTKEELNNSRWKTLKINPKAIKPVQFEWFDKIIDLTSKNDVRLIVTFLPIPTLSESYIQGYSDFIELLQKNYKSDNLEYVLFSNKELGLGDTIHYSDPDHLNYLGSKIVTEALGQKLNEKVKVEEPN